MAQQDRAPILQMRHVSKRFGAVQALSDVDFEVYPGEVVGLVGDNGAGKSTLVKIISGVYRADSGQHIFEGREVSVTNPRDATALGIETVYQDLCCATISMWSPTCTLGGSRSSRLSRAL